MSTSSVRRIKERGGGGGKAAPTAVASAGVPGSEQYKSVTPLSGKSVSLGSAGKENPRPTSRVRASTQKPTIRPMARTDKSSAVVVEEPRTRSSTSSVPRGRSSSPFEISRALSDLRKSSRVSDEKRVNVSNSKGLRGKRCEKDDLERANLRDSGKSSRNFEKLELNSQGNENSKFRVSNGNLDKKEVNVGSNSVKRSELESSSREKCYSESGTKSKVLEDVKLKSSANLVEVRSNARESKQGNKVNNVTSVSRENGTNKYPSRLHEKLAFLEGKVKRIATDIKKTKEMLDMNNPDATKMILSDIQEKISGIEKAMGHVACSDEDAKKGSGEHSRNDDKKDEKHVVDVKSSVKGLNVEELEARLFPHHKLIRDRSLSKTASGGFESNEIKAEESTTELRDEKLTHSVDENPIAAEFLASLGKMETTVGCTKTSEIHEMEDSMNSAAENSSLNVLNGKGNIDAILMADEKLDEFDDQERTPAMIIEEEVEDNPMHQLNDIGHKTSMAGWFVSEGESVLLAHDDGSCSFYDIANSEEKAQYKPPVQVSPNIWRDCWIIRAASADGCSGRYVVAASAGNSVDSGFCSWDFYTKDVRAFHIEDETTHTRTALAPLANNTMYRRNVLSTHMATESRQWWYKPCGPLIVSTASCQRMARIYDIRDGEEVMKWELHKPVAAMDYSSPLQWRNRGKVVVAEADSVSLWDVGSLSPQPLLSIPSSGRKICALHVNNSDAELGGGVRQRASSSEAEGNDGVFCTPDSINVLDFRHPSGTGLKIPRVGVDVQSTFSRGDSVFIGCTNLKSALKKPSCSQIQQFSLQKQRLFSTYELPESNAHSHFTALTQVWGNSNHVMGICGLGLFVFDALRDDTLLSFKTDSGNTQNVNEVIGPDDMFSPSFDYLGSRVLLISRDRPALWRYL